jgi:hypothetical protein
MEKKWRAMAKMDRGLMDGRAIDQQSPSRRRPDGVSMNTVYRIYTEDLNRSKIIRLASKTFDSFTLQPTTGYYRGKPELEIVEVQQSEVTALANAIRRLNGQKSVLIMGLTGKAKKVKR